MATLIKTDGSKLEIQPQNGLDFQLDELQKFVDGYIEIINLHNGDILVINDNGKDVLDSNETATEIAHKHNAIFGWDYICGMSVPPVMMAQVATRVYEQWLSKL